LLIWDGVSRIASNLVSVPLGASAQEIIYGSFTWPDRGLRVQDDPNIPDQSAMVLALAAHTDGRLYVGGYFNYAGERPTRAIAAWDGEHWIDIGSTGDGQPVTALAPDVTGLYAGGFFSEIGGIPLMHIGRWDGATWHPLGTGVNSDVSAIYCSASLILDGIECLVRTHDLRQDVLEVRGPHERPRALVVGGDEVVDRVFQVCDAGEAAAADALGGDLAEPAFDQVQPRARGRDEVHVEAWMFREPLADAGMLVPAVVVDDQVQVQLRRRPGVDELEELEPFLMTVPRLAVADDAAAGDLQGREERGCAVAFV
jgi:hypothetical protein